MRNAIETWKKAGTVGWKPRMLTRTKTAPQAYETDDRISAISPGSELVEPPLRPWLNRTTTPKKPTISPTSRLSVIASSDSASEAMTIVNSGVVAWRMAASDESM